MIANKHKFWCRGVSKLLILVLRDVQTINAHLNTHFKLKFRCCGMSKLLWPNLNSYLMVNIPKFWCHRVPKLSLPIYHMINIHTFWCRGVSKITNFGTMGCPHLMVKLLKIWCRGVPLGVMGAVGCLSYGKYHMVN